MGGIEQVINQIASGAVNQGVEVDVLSLTDDPNVTTIKINGYHAHRAHLNFELSSTGVSFSSFLRFIQLAKKADIIHYHFPWPFMDLVHFIARVKKPTVVTYHSDIIRQKKLLKLYKPLMKMFLASVDHIVATSPNYKATSKILQDYSEKVTVIPIGIDKENYPLSELSKLQYWRKKVGSKFFLFVGLLRYYKGLHILIEAARNADYPIVIVGSGPNEKELKKQVALYGLKNIIFLGYLSDQDKVALLTLCYAIVFPSHLRSEAFGISLLEGAMFGKPLISTEIGTGTSYINIDKETGLVVPPDNSIALKAAMDYLWENPVEANSMGQNAEARYWKMFTAKKMTDSYVTLYKTLIDKK